MGELGRTPESVSDPLAVVDATRCVTPQRPDHRRLGFEGPFELRPDFPDGSSEMRVRGTERWEIELHRQLPSARLVFAHVLRVVHFDPVETLVVGAEIVGLEADGGELGMRREDGGLLPFELCQCALQRDEIRDRLGEPDREDVFPVPPVAGEHLTTRNDEQLRIAEPLGPRADLRKPNEMRRVHDPVEPSALRSLDGFFGEYLYVRIEAKPVHRITTGRYGVIRSDSAGTVLYMDIVQARMWECAIGGCEYTTENPEELLVHQVKTHERHRCSVCGTTVPDGYFAIKHAFSEHSRAEYLRNYEADTDDIRLRETVLRELESEADVDRVLRQLNGERQKAATEA